MVKRWVGSVECEGCVKQCEELPTSEEDNCCVECISLVVVVGGGGGGGIDGGGGNDDGGGGDAAFVLFFLFFFLLHFLFCAIVPSLQLLSQSVLESALIDFSCSATSDHLKEQNMAVNTEAADWITEV
jgi:hypothetical protein